MHVYFWLNPGKTDVLLYLQKVIGIQTNMATILIKVLYRKDVDHKNITIKKH